MRTELDGHTFASRAEARRYAELRIMERAGEIAGIELQPRFRLQDSFSYNGKRERPIDYIADFRYRRVADDVTVIEDVKGHRERVYQLKRKLFLRLFILPSDGSMEFVEVSV